jgi:hypothetical protein
MLLESLDKINLHDSILLGIRIGPTNGDRIELLLDYAEDYEGPRKECRKKLVFSHCIKVVADLNFFLATPDTIETGYEMKSSALVEETRETLGKMGIVTDPRTKHFFLRMASSGSTMGILAAQAELLPE